MKLPLVGLFVVGVLAAWFPSDVAMGQDADAKGWLDLFPGPNLKGWKRVPISPDTKLSERNPWSVDADKKLLLCDATGKIKEMLLYDKLFTDGTFHVEWRFRPTEEKLGYNSGIYVRTKDGKDWVQAQVAMLDKAPFVGDLFGDFPVNGKVDRVIVKGEGRRHVKPVGQWNTMEVTAKGKTLKVYLNGKLATTMEDCPFATGHVGLQAEFYFIEFRDLKFKQ